MEQRASLKDYLLLHAVLLIYSLASVCSKLASGETGITLRFVLLYGGVLFLLMAYAVVWQQAIRRIPLSVAYANKAVTVLWGLVWGMLLFNERMTPGKALGGVLIITGILLFAAPDKEEQNA